jgi:hypothetical protein
VFIFKAHYVRSFADMIEFSAPFRTSWFFSDNFTIEI